VCGETRRSTSRCAAKRRISGGRAARSTAIRDG
jgi:hypothetical protein